MKVNMPYDGEVEVYSPTKATAEKAIELISSCDVTTVNKRTYSDCYMAFDIETTTLPNMNWDGLNETLSHFNTTFCWQLYITKGKDYEGMFIFGRDPKEFFMLIKYITKKLGCTPVCYIHNLSYEYNNLCELFLKGCDPKDPPFFKSKIRPLFFRSYGVEFRCSAELSHMSLAKIGGDLGIPKLKGDFDYSVCRFTDTPLSPLEMNYCFRDVFILVRYIESKVIELSHITGKEKKVANLPYTQTGYPRRDIREFFTRTPVGHKVNQEICKLTREQYTHCNKAFWGGFVQANYNYIACKLKNIFHVDLTSAYPAAMVMFKYPFHLGEVKGRVSAEEYYRLCYKEDMAVVAEITLENISIKDGQIPYIPLAKCSVKENVRSTNGKIVEASKITLTLCEVDFLLIDKVYSTHSGEPIVNNLTVTGMVLIGTKRRLPIQVVFSVLRYFEGKTKYKGVDGKEIEYAISKQMLNGIFGLSATGLLHSRYYVEDLETRTGEMEYTESTVLPYQWCVYITAYVRRWIYGFITNLSNTNKWAYADTDSLFLFSDEETRSLVEAHNDKIHKAIEELEQTFPVVQVSPKGKKQYLGLLLNDEDTDTGLIDEFCTVGAKRYYTVTTKNGVQTTTVTFAGMSGTKPIKKGATFSEEVQKEYDTTPGAPGINVQRMIKKYGSLWGAFKEIAKTDRPKGNTRGVELDYLEGVDQLIGVNIRAEPGSCFYYKDDTHEIREKASYVLTRRKKTYTLVPDLFSMLLHEGCPMM